MAEFTSKRTFQAPGLTVVEPTTVESGLTTTLDAEPIADGSTDLEVNVAFSLTDLKGFAMIATQDMTVKTNSSGSPQETFNLTANNAVIYMDGIDAAIFAGDVTDLFVTNASGTDGTLTVTYGHDATP